MKRFFESLPRPKNMLLKQKVIELCKSAKMGFGQTRFFVPTMAVLDEVEIFSVPPAESQCCNSPTQLLPVCVREKSGLKRPSSIRETFGEREREMSLERKLSPSSARAREGLNNSKLLLQKEGELCVVG